MGGAPSIAFKEPSEINTIEKESVLRLEPGEEPSLSAIARRIREGEIKKIVCLCGAGISVSCGIPDFRSEGTGLYHNLQKYDLDTPQSIFDIEFFKKNPRPFIHLAKELFPGQYKPSPTHYFMKLLEKKGKLLRVYTQNIDGLEFEAGLGMNKVIQCHGGFQTSHCIDCQAPCDNARLKTDLMAEKETHCDKCSGLCKPGITFFGESLPRRYHDAKSVDFVRYEKQCCINECNTPTMIKPDGTFDFFCKNHTFSDKDKKTEDISDMSVEETEMKADTSMKIVKEHENDEKGSSTEEAPDLGAVRCECDLLIVLGTSLQVAPVAGLVDEVHWLCPRLLINREKVHVHGGPKPEWPPQFGPDNGFRFDSEDNYRDVACIEDCDVGVRHLADLLGWGADLNEMIASGQECK